MASPPKVKAERIGQYGPQRIGSGKKTNKSNTRKSKANAGNSVGGRDTASRTNTAPNTASVSRTNTASKANKRRADYQQILNQLTSKPSSTNTTVPSKKPNVATSDVKDYSPSKKLSAYNQNKARIKSALSGSISNKANYTR